MRRDRSFEVGETSVSQQLGNAILNIRVLLQAVAFVVAVVALRAWGPLEVQLKIDSLTQVPLARTGAAARSAWEQAAGIARSMQHTIGWPAEASSTSAPDGF